MRVRAGASAPLCYEFHADFDIIHHLRNAMGFAFPPIRGLGEPARSGEGFPPGDPPILPVRIHPLSCCLQTCCQPGAPVIPFTRGHAEPVSFPLNSYVPTPTRVVKGAPNLREGGIDCLNRVREHGGSIIIMQDEQRFPAGQLPRRHL